MKSRFDATLAGRKLTAAVPEARVLDIKYTPATIADSMYKTGYGSFATMTDRKYSGAAVQIEVEIHEYDPEVRNAACQALMQWAIKGGVLKTSDRPEQRLNVVCSNAPAIASALKWTDRVSVQFTAAENPFWVADTPQQFTLAGPGSWSLSVDGCVDKARVTATIKSGTKTASGSAITSFSLKCGSTTITLSGINVAKRDSIVIGYDGHGFLSIKTGSGTNLMKYRTGADELLMDCGKTSTVKITCNTAVTCVMEVRGNWL